MVQVTTTAGVVLDPFSINATGLARKHSSLKTGKAGDLHAGLHGEAKFKQAFINACHFAESMSVVGPIGQLVWDKEIVSPIYHSLFWEGENLGENKRYSEFIKKMLDLNKWDRVNPSMLGDIHKMRLHVQPDFCFGKYNLGSSGEFPDVDSMSDWGTAHRMIRHHFGSGYYDVGNSARYKSDSTLYRGAPVLGLMAVIFTFKKPTGSLEVFELTNLASWPPVVFFLPVLMPAGATINPDGHVPNQDYKRVIDLQPGMMSYRLALNNDQRVKPYGQPFKLMSVDPRGKTPDTLRSLSDVFKALWSQATQYCAWNSGIDFDPEEGWDTSLPQAVSMALEPLGAGRRIRGHNRFMGMYNMDNVQLLWEENIQTANAFLKRWGSNNKNVQPFIRQLRSKTTGKKETIFVLPSYFSESTAKNLQPLALALMRYMQSGPAGLDTFLAGDLLRDANPWPSAGSEAHVSRGHSFLDNVLKTFKVPEDGKNGGALPLHRFTGQVEFNPDGDPTVFGLRTKKEETEQIRKLDEDLRSEDYEKIVENTEALGNFQFLDAFCSKSTKDLTEVFEEVKEKALTGERGTKAVDMLEDTMRVDLFGSEDLLF